MVGEVPILEHDTAKIFFSFVVEYLVFNYMAVLLETVRDAVVCGNSVAFMLGLEGFHEYGVAVAVVG